MSNFRTRLKELRNEQKISQAELSKLIGFSQGAIAHWELGKAEPSTSTLINLAEQFHVTVDYLVGRTDERQPKPVIQPISDNMIEVSPFEREVLLKYRVMPPSEQMYVCRMLQLTHPAQARANIKNA